MQGELYNELLKQQIQNHAETMKALGSMESKMESIHEETRKTNGRVTKLEQQVQELKESRSYARGGIAMASGISVFIGSAITILYDYVKGK